MESRIDLNVIAPDGWPQWRELRLRALEEAPYAFRSRFEEWEDADEARWRQRLSFPGSYNLIARLDGDPVGMAGGVPDDAPGAVKLVSMWVAPEFRGKGVGAALITAVVEWARDRGAQELRLDVVTGNANAIALYIRHGFVDVGPSREVGERAMVKVL